MAELNFTLFGCVLASHQALPLSKLYCTKPHKRAKWSRSSSRMEENESERSSSGHIALNVSWIEILLIISTDKEWCFLKKKLGSSELLPKINCLSWESISTRSLQLNFYKKMFSTSFFLFENYQLLDFVVQFLSLQPAKSFFCNVCCSLFSWFNYYRKYHQIWR